MLRSFSGDTEVLLASGDTIDIADVQVGDVVFAHDPESGVSGGRAVTAVWPHTDTLVEFEVGDGTVTTTEDHEFWNVTDQAWQETQHIDQGDLLLTAEGATVEAGVLLWDTAHFAPAYDLTVDGIHTYHVAAGEQMVLVHNTDCQELLDELEENGIAHTPENVVRIGRNADGQVVFLEVGTAEGPRPAGLAHILDEHGVDFANRGVSADEVPDLVLDAVTRGDLVEVVPNGAMVFDVEFNGVVQRLQVTVGSNGFIVQANPRSR